ncbi:recombinase family protein [uncultured Ruminococcus sp.]|uniref:recombinase family protein n=1 Tax=uncultured Ruminococcus sp. TaxID=165186 RepID=UPI002616E899|nr:recombinase family protein [uncultured Ruminococcus sp.]
MKDNRKFAIYSRKSRFTGKGESIGNQIELCKQNICLSYPDITDEDILIFEDEGFSGGNTNRPQFQKMMKLCRQKEIQCIVCYRLDRISRNVCDYSSMIEELNKLNVSFISVSEKFDTSTTMGRAMMYIASVFAQLERETIAERIRDNMLELAKDGRWLGGNPPTGYKSVETIGSITIDGKTRKARKLEVIPEEAELVKLIYAKFLEYRSLSKTETFLLQNDYRSKNNKPFSRFAIKGILSNPVYLIADETAWNYFETRDMDIYSEQSEFNGKYGITAYNKTSQKVGQANEIRDMKDWIISVGKHKGIISSHDWVEVQKLLEQNKSKSYRKPRSNVALLSGLLFCGKCGSFMRPKLSQRKNKDGELIYDYLCELKEKSKSQKCDMKRPNGNELDKMVCAEIKKLSEDKSAFMTMLRKEQRSLNINDASYQEKLRSLRKSKSDHEAKIKNLVSSLTTAEGTSARDYILKEINELDEKTKALQTQIQEYEDLAKADILSDTEFESLAESLCSFADSFDSLPIEQKRSAIRTFVRKVVWDGNNIHIYFFGAENDEIEPSDDANLEPLRMDYK